MDFSSFADEKFDAVAWVNESLQAAKSDSLDAFISSMIMKLQLLSQEVSSSFEETSAQTLVRMPRALLEVERMGKEAKSLRQTLTTLLQGDLANAQRHTHEAVERMNTLHQLRLKLDACTDTLAQVSFLQGGVARMGTVFAAGNTVAIGAEIAQMQAALQRLADYPEQHGRFAATVAEFEARLVGLVEADCLEALVGHDVAKTQDHLTTLRNIGRADGVVRQFIQRSVPPILAAWRAYDADSDFAVWLPTFFGEIKAFVSRERPYYLEVFGAGEYPRQGASLVIGILEALDPSFQSRIAGMPLPALVAAYSATALLFSYCCTEFLEAPGGALDAAATAELRGRLEHVIYQPYLPQQRRYDQLEKGFLQVSIRRFPWVERATDPTAPATLTPALVQSIGEASAQLFVLAEEGLNRCLEFTEGVESQGFLTVLNDVLVEYADLIGRLVKSHTIAEDAPPPKSPLGPPRSPIPASPIDNRSPDPKSSRRDPSTIKVGLHLHQICLSIAGKLDKFEAVARTLILSKRGTMLRDKSPLLRDNLGKTTTLAYFLSSLESLKLPVFSVATKHFQLLGKEVETLVFNALFDQVRGWLSGLPRLDVWARAGAEGHLVEHPLEYIRSIGDYLFDLPMLVMSQTPTGGQGGEEGDEGAASRYWVDIVVRGCLDLLLQSIEQIPRLSPAGCDQLACDIDYFKDVLVMLSDSPYPVLQDLYTLLRCDVAELNAQLGAVACPERLPLYRSLRAKRTPLPPASPLASAPAPAPAHP